MLWIFRGIQLIWAFGGGFLVDLHLSLHVYNLVVSMRCITTSFVVALGRFNRNTPFGG
jgi:hypothetical protein